MGIWIRTNMLNRKETKYDKDLRKVIGLHHGLQVRDYFGVVLSADMYKTHTKPLRQFLDVGVGDHVMLISFQWKSPKHRERAQKEMIKVFEQYKLRPHAQRNTGKSA